MPFFEICLYKHQWYLCGEAYFVKLLKKWYATASVKFVF